MYPNDVAAASCQDDEDETTFEKFRREIIAGGDRDPRVAVDRAESIESRLRQLVAWLAANRGAEGWGQFLDGGDISWAKVVLTGHSQGGGHAQLMAIDHAVARVVVFGSQRTTTSGMAGPHVGTGLAQRRRVACSPWCMGRTRRPAATSSSLKTCVPQDCTATADIDAIAPPFNDAHVLTTNQPGTEVNSALAHLGLVFDFMLPRAKTAGCRTGRPGSTCSRLPWSERASVLPVEVREAVGLAADRRVEHFLGVIVGRTAVAGQAFSTRKPWLAMSLRVKASSMRCRSVPPNCRSLPSRRDRRRAACRPA